MTDLSDWELSSYDYVLPEGLIASRPSEKRDGSRLLLYNEEKDEVSHHYFYELPKLLPENSHLVLNQSKVYPCRLVGKKETGGKGEIFLLNLGEERDYVFYYDCLIKSRGPKELGQHFFFDEYVKGTISKIYGDGRFEVFFNLDQEYFLDFLERKALIPLPPYIRDGLSDEKDRVDYQTVFAKELGSVAAPTAGLHFTEGLLAKIPHSYVNLHVGLGTFKPVDSEDIRGHSLHREFFSIPKDSLKNLNEKRENLIAVGTTSLRVLESSWANRGFSCPEEGRDTDIFLYPGVKVNSIKGLITNFHLPKSSLLMLVSALIGRKKTLELYGIAIQKQYRFYSYGDAMLILRKGHV